MEKSIHVQDALYMRNALPAADATARSTTEQHFQLNAWLACQSGPELELW